MRPHNMRPPSRRPACAVAVAIKRLTSLVCVLAMATACSFIPEYQPPPLPTPQQWPASVASAANGEGASVVVSDDWRSFFTDARLQELIASALENNRDLRIAAARVEEARLLSRVASGRIPTIGFNLRQQAALTPAGLSAFGRSNIGRRYDANIGVADFEVDLWGSVDSLDASLLAKYLASDFARNAFRLSLIAEVGAAWYSHGEATARLRLAAAAAANRDEAQRLLEQRRDAGLATQQEVLAAVAEASNAHAALAVIERQRDLIANALGLLVGADSLTLPPTDIDLAVAVQAPEIAVGLPAEVLLRRPDIKAAEQRLIAANADIGAARARFFPRITLTALAGVASPLLRQLFDGDTRSWTFMPSLWLPLYDQGRFKDLESAAAARLDAAAAEYDKSIQQAFRQVADLLAARQRLAGQLISLQQAEQAHAERLAQATTRATAGLATRQEVLAAQLQHITAQQATLAARWAQAVTAADLYKALGGAGTTAHP